MSVVTDPNATGIGIAVEALDVKTSVRIATTANITLSGTQTIDGVAVVSDDRVLVKNQTTGSENGIYVVKSGAWSRSLDADLGDELTAALNVFVEEGTANADTGWLLTTNMPITIGTTALVFSQYTGGTMGAPTDAQYLVLAANSSLTAERVITISTANGLRATDAGANGAYTIFNTLIEGLAGGQTVIGGTGAGDDLILRATSNASAGDVVFQTNSSTDALRIFGTGSMTAILPLSFTRSVASAVDNTLTINNTGSGGGEDIRLIEGSSSLVARMAIVSTSNATYPTANAAYFVGNFSGNPRKIIYGSISGSGDDVEIWYGLSSIAISISSGITTTQLQLRTTSTATTSAIRVGSVAGDPSTLANGDLWYDSTGNLWRARVNAASDTFAFLAATQTLSNKTLSSPVLSGTATGTYTLAGTPTVSVLLSLTAAVNLKTTAITGATTLDATHCVVFASASGGAFTVTLPTAVGNAGRVYSVKKTDSSANAVTVDGAGAETIDGAANVVLSLQNERIIVVSDGANWFRVD